ncbi:Retrovirus-related Pol polyprotein from transposon RE1 [Glycine soja]|uniref:Retrovirus-related Pol polyprotein from transposon RE1 n=1 Tax=Glycine soja TaxID=3848 RepID=A0A445JVB7_GLYSO|nr:Retrovirus-related Pol polyprotein from transposon RE1 [Glycine soja]
MAPTISTTTNELKELMEFNNNFHFSIKLTATNYPAWYKQVHALLIVRDLEGYVIGKIVSPPATVGSNDAAAPNPAYSLWIRQDKLIYLALLGSCDFEARSIMAAADTSRDAWVALAQNVSITKGTSSISTYLLSIHNIADELALISHPIDYLEMVIHTLNGLGPTFREFTASIRTRDSPIAFIELYDKLVDFKMYFQR